MTDALAPSAETYAHSAAVRHTTALPSTATREPFTFSGAAGEYFGIWIVNLLLTLITVGLYSPWAKVRRKRYFYGNTWLAGTNFEYHGNALAILKGRLIAFVAFAAYTGVTHFWPKVGAALLLAMMPAVPWLIVRTFAFNALNSSYRNLRFHFRGTYASALAAIWPFALVPAATLLLPAVDVKHPARGWADLWFLLIPSLIAMVFYPYVVARVKRLQVNGTRFGTTPLRCDAATRRFYGAYAIGLLLMVGIGALVGVLSGVVAAAAAFAKIRSPVLLIAAVGLVYSAMGVLMLSYTRSRIVNLVFNHSSLDGRWRFESRIRARRLIVLYATNLVAIILTLGLMIPWAAIRVARYRAQCLALEGDGSVDAFMADASRDVAAAGQEMGEMFDVDLSL